MTARDTYFVGAIVGLFYIYSLALLSSLAAMEAFGGLIMILGGVWFFLQRRKEPRPKPSLALGLEVPLWGLIAVGALGLLLHAPEQSDKVHAFGKLRWVFSLYLMTYTVQMVGVQRLWPVFRWLLLVGGLVGVYGVVQHFTGLTLVREQAGFPAGNVWRTQGFFSMPLTYAYSFSILTCFLIAASVFAKQQSLKILWGCLATIVGLSVVLSFTRGAWIALAGAVPVMLWLVNRRALVAVGVAAAIAGGAGLAVSPDFRDRVATLFDKENESNSHRLNIWRANLEIFTDYPLIGIGYGQNERVMEQYYQRLQIENGFIGHAHNNYLQFLSGTGLLGFALYMWLIVLILLICLRLWRRIPQGDRYERAIVLGAIGAHISLHIGGLTECNFKDMEVNHLFVLSSAVILVLARKYRVQTTMFPLFHPNSKH